MYTRDLLVDIPRGVLILDLARFCRENKRVNEFILLVGRYKNAFFWKPCVTVNFVDGNTMQRTFVNLLLS